MRSLFVQGRYGVLNVKLFGHATAVPSPCIRGRTRQKYVVAGSRGKPDGTV